MSTLTLVSIWPGFELSKTLCHKWPKCIILALMFFIWVLSFPATKTNISNLMGKKWTRLIRISVPIYCFINLIYCT